MGPVIVSRRALLLVAATVTAAAVLHASQPALAVRLTSPLGRTGVSGTTRIVAQVVTPAPGLTIRARFFVDGAPAGEDTDGPPYWSEWVDDNPYELRHIAVEVDDGRGAVVRDSVDLQPLEVLEESSVASVLLDASVTDAERRSVPTLGVADFTVFEDGAKQSLDLVRLQSSPTQFTLLVDGSQSMARRINVVRATAARLITRLRAGDRVIVAPFRRGIEAFTGPTADAATIAAAIVDIRAGGGTAILDSLAQLPDVFARAPGRQVVVLVTDGYDEHSRISADVALERLTDLRATVYVIGVGGVAGISLKGEMLLRRIAVQSGGRAFFPTREEQLPDVYEAITTDVYSRYLISYTPARQEPDGSYRTIRLQVSDPKWTVRTRAGYFAPRPSPVRPVLEFSATSNAGDAAPLEGTDLIVTEDGTPQRIDAFQEATAPMSIVLALDGSGSIRPALDAIKAAARTFVSALRPSDPLALVEFADGVSLAHDFSATRQPTLDAIDAHRASGGTALWDGLESALALLGRREGRRAIVVMTDGRDENAAGNAPGSRQAFADVKAHASDTQTAIYVIGLGANVDREALTELSRESGGAAYFPSEAGEIAAHYRRVLDDLRRRYVITYTSTNSNRDGAWRTVTIASRRADVVIHSGNGYRAPRHGVPSVTPE